MRSFGRLFGAGVLGAVVIASPRPLLAQAPPGTPQGNAPGTPPGPPPMKPTPAPNLGPPKPTPATPTPSGTGNTTGTTPGTGAAGGGVPGAAPNTIPDVSRASNTSDMTSATAGGLTAEQVAQRAAQTSYQAKAAEQTATSAQAKADAQWVTFLPRFTVTGRYTRLSDFDPPSFGGGGALVGTIRRPGQQITSVAELAPVDLKIPLVLNQWLAQASITIPISDYFLRINQGYTASTKSAEAAQHDILAARAKSYSDGKIAYFQWLRARGAVGVTEQSLAAARSQLKDAENQFTVGNASKVDVLRAQTLVAVRELDVERAKSAVEITERAVRVAIHAKDDEKLTPAESLDGPVSAAPGALRPMIDEAHRQREEIKSIDKNAEAARKLVSVQNAGKYPTLGAFGDVIYGNPNQRRFPQTQDGFTTWQVGAQLTWSPNDFLTAGSNASDVEARAAALDAQKSAVRDGIELEVTQAYQAIIEADAAITSTQHGLESALEGYRVARELFNNGRGTGTTLIDAENALAQARVQHLYARVDARIARARLEHALGRDVKGGPTP